MSCLACAVFALAPPIPGIAYSAEADSLGRANAELVPVVANVPQAPVRTVVPPKPNPYLPDNGVTWVPTMSSAEPPLSVALVPQDVSIRVIVTVNGEDHVIEIPTVTVGEIVQALAPAAPIPTPVAPALGPVALTLAPAMANREPAVITPRMPAPDGPGVYRVQVGSFARTALAQGSFDRLRSAGFNDAAFERFGSMYRVVIPGVRAAEMSEVARRLGNAGFGEAWARREN